MPITRDDFVEGVPLPRPDDVIGWVVRNGDEKIVDWGPAVQAQMIGAAREGDPDGGD